MRFIIDAHLPRALCQIFIDLGHDAAHTSELPDGNATNDQDILLTCGKDGVVISKDGDFYESFLLHRRPPKLIYVKVGNMRLKDIKALFREVAPQLVDLLGQHDMLELHQDKVVAIA